MDFAVTPDPNEPINPQVPPATGGAPTGAIGDVASGAVPRATDAREAVPAGTETPGRRWDVVVVGGGIGGLAVASLLAKAGRAVLLLEESARLGGACLGAAPDGHRYDLGVGVMTGAGPDGAVAALCQRLGVGLPTIACDPTVQVALPRHRVDLTRSVEGWWPEIHREFPEEEAGWHALVSDLTSLARDRDQLAQHLPPLPPEGWRERLLCWRILTLRGLRAETRQATRQLRRAAGTPFGETLETHGLGTASRQTLEACLWYLLLRGPEECSTLEAALALQRLREGVAVVPRGPAVLADLLAERVVEHGGEIRLQTGVARCLAARGRIVGVTTKAGETIHARWVVTDVPPGILTGELLPASRGRFRHRRPPQGPWQPRCVAQALGVTIPEAFLPSELGWLCLVVRDAGRPARDENLVFVRRMSDANGEGLGEGFVRLSVGRFVPPSTSASDEAVEQALLEALDHVIPGVGAVAVHGWLAHSSVLGELWGRPMAAVRYEADAREWLGRRGFPHRVGWPGLLAVGEWTYPGRLVSDVVEGAMRVADLIAAAE
jgi:phytoene dehydrogenase-like protein